MLVAQLDYIYFFFGLVLFLLGCVCVSMSRAGPLRAPWWLLGAFAFAHGASEWLQLLALTSSDSERLSLVRAVLVASSFFFLLEFARRMNWTLHGATPPPWLHLLVGASVLGLAFCFGAAHLDAAVRLLVATPAAMWTAALSLSAASRTHELGGGLSSRRARRWNALHLGAFGLAAGVVVPRAPFLPGRWPSPEAVLAWTGIPIQLVRALLVCGMALSVWALAVSFEDGGCVVRKKRVLFWVMATSIVALLAGGWIFTNSLGRLHERDLVNDAEASTSQIYDHLIMEMQEPDRVARSLAELLSRFHPHASGDQILNGVARLLQSHVRESDIIARWGGEEFVIVASMTEAQGAVQLAEKLRSFLEAAPLGVGGPVTGSFGVAELRADDTIEELLQRADIALYTAKNAGRNRVACAEPLLVEAAAGLATLASSPPRS